MKCPKCNSEEFEVKEYNKMFNVKGKMIEETIKSKFCTKCSSLVYDEELDNEASKKVINKYLNKYGIEPNKITELRKKYSLSLDLFSKIIGCAKKTLISYEKGLSIPNDTYMIMLKTLIQNENMLEIIIDANKEQFSNKEYENIKNKVYKYLGNNIKNIYLNNNELTINNGYTRFSFLKLKETIAYLSKNGIHKTKLLKELFYADFKCYKEYGYSITGLEYARINYGPVPDNYETILSKLAEEKMIKIDYKVQNNREEFLIKSNDVNISNLNKNEIEILDNIIKKFKNYNVGEIVNFSHNEKGFKETKKGKIISYEYAFDLQI